jgi:hypothetical protein
MAASRIFAVVNDRECSAVGSLRSVGSHRRFIRNSLPLASIERLVDRIRKGGKFVKAETKTFLS